MLSLFKKLFRCCKEGFKVILENKKNWKFHPLLKPPKNKPKRMFLFRSPSLNYNLACPSSFRYSLSQKQYLLQSLCPFTASPIHSLGNFFPRYYSLYLFHCFTPSVDCLSKRGEPIWNSHKTFLHGIFTPLCNVLLFLMKCNNLRDPFCYALHNYSIDP